MEWTVTQRAGNCSDIRSHESLTLGVWSPITAARGSFTPHYIYLLCTPFTVMVPRTQRHTCASVFVETCCSVSLGGLIWDLLVKLGHSSGLKANLEEGKYWLKAFCSNPISCSCAPRSEPSFLSAAEVLSDTLPVFYLSLKVEPLTQVYDLLCDFSNVKAGTDTFVKALVWGAQAPKK